MLEADALVTRDGVAAHIPFEGPMHPAGFAGNGMAQKAPDVRAVEGAQAVEDKGRIQASQLAIVLEEEIGGVLRSG